MATNSQISPSNKAEKLKSSAWFILKTKSNNERKVHDSLVQQGFEAYLPSYSTIRVWSDRKKKVEVPLLPSYVFVCCPSDELITAAKTKGVAWVMRELGEYATVKDYEIQNLRIYLSEEVNVNDENLEEFQVGSTVRVIRGPFNGLIGTALHHQNEYRVRIEISSLGTEIVVSVPKSQLEIIKK